MSNLDKGRFSYWKYCKKPDFQCQKSAPDFHLFYLKFSLACVQTFPLPQDKSGEETTSPLPIFLREWRRLYTG